VEQSFASFQLVECVKISKIDWVSHVNERAVVVVVVVYRIWFDELLTY
jgi:hypothetical protein